MNFNQRRSDFAWALVIGVILVPTFGYKILTDYEELYPFVELELSYEFFLKSVSPYVVFLIGLGALISPFATTIQESKEEKEKFQKKMEEIKKEYQRKQSLTPEERQKEEEEKRKINRASILLQYQNELHDIVHTKKIII